MPLSSRSTSCEILITERTMAASPLKLELPSQCVQELLKNIGEQIPQRYICPENIQLSNEIIQDSALPLMESNIIDLSLLSASSSSQSEQELRKLLLAISSWGCFQIINHGMVSNMDQVRETNKEFFGLPLEAKQKYARKADSPQGYGADTVSEVLPINWNDRLHLKVHPDDMRDYKFWPQEVPNFRMTLNEYTAEIMRVKEELLKAIAKSLNLEENIFFNHCGEQAILFARFTVYPPCPLPDQVVGLGPHSDGSVITILQQDKEVEGLQVLKDNQWFRVPIIPNALFVNIGDQLEIMSNGVFKSAVHKVVTNRERERMSVVIQCAGNPGVGVGPLSEFIDDERPALYKTVEDYALFYYKNIARGQQPIDAMKIAAI